MIIFDLDGTLWDTIDVTYQAVINITSKRNDINKIMINASNSNRDNSLKNEFEIVNNLEKSIINNFELFEEVNKIDLKNDISLDIPYPIIKISAKENIGIEKLKETIINLFNQNEIETEDLTYLTNARSIALLKQAKDSLESSLNSINNNMPTDISEIDLKEAWNLLGQIIGKTYEDELIDKLFSKFCLGK